MTTKQPALYGGLAVRDERLPIFRLELTPGDRQAVQTVLESGQIARGPVRNTWEGAFANYAGCRQAVALSSGTAALHVGMRLLDLEPGSEVIVPSFTFIATAQVIEHCGLVPVFSEIDPTTLNIDAEDVARRITPRTRAILPVHYAGRPVHLSAIADISDQHGLAVVEDAAHALGIRLGDTFRHHEHWITAFSFFATKHITAGEGGMLCCEDDALAARARRLRAHGLTPFNEGPRTSGYYDVRELGWNYHVSELSAALALSQLPRLDEINRRRVSAANALSDRLADLDTVQLPRQRLTEDGDHLHHIYSVRLRLEGLTVDRDTFVEALLAEGIQAGVFYPPIHLFSYYKERWGTKRGDLPITERIADTIVTLPLFPTLTSAELDDIASALRKLCSYFRR